MKKLLTGVLASLMLLSLTSCGTGADKDQSENSSEADDNIVTIPLSDEGAEYLELLKKYGSSDMFSEANYPNLLKFMEDTERNTFPAVWTKAELSSSGISGNQVYTLENANADCIIIYLHGGAFIFGIDSSQVGLCDKLAEKMNAKVVMPLYSLLPEGTCNDALSFLDEVYDEALKEEKAVYIMGDSSGGGLALAFTEYLRDQGKVLPERLVLFSPWLDMTLSDPDQDIYDEKDIQFESYGLKELGKLWADELDVKDPYVSPIYGDLTGLPPILLFSGTDEIMYPDVTRLYALLQDAENEASLVYGEKLWHIFVVYDIPEADEAVDMTAEFCKK